MLLDKEKALYIQDFNFNVSDVLPSDYAEANRVMTSEVSKFRGRYSYDRTPYIREIVDCLSPYNPINIVSIMKGLQIGISTGLIENGTAYLISEHPTNIMLVSGNAELTGKMMNRIDQAIDTCGLRSRMGVTSQRKSRQTGDTAKEKRFAGGSLITYGGQAIDNMRQNSVEVIYADDVDAFKGKTSNAGAFSRVMEGRAASYGSSRKIFYISTPETKEASIIEPMFLQGDQRYYYMPCPCCGEYIRWEWRGKRADGMEYGVLFDVKDGRVVEKTVRYVCNECGNHFFENKHKTDMLQAGIWKPTAEPIAKNFRSYHISSLYAPVGMNNWTDYATMYQKAAPVGGIEDESELHAFNNTVLGLTWENKGLSPKSIKIMNNTRDYAVKEVPFELSNKDNNGEIVLLTCAVDLNGEMEGVFGCTQDDVRLDYEIVAWSEKGASYSVSHGSVGTFINRRQRSKDYDNDRVRWTYRHGSDNNVWDTFKDIVSETYSGMLIDIIGIDTGNFTTYANDFVFNLKYEGINCIALKGEKTESFRQSEDDKAWFKKSTEQKGLYLVNGNKIKDSLAAYMELNPYENGQPSNFMNFPTPSENMYNYKSYFNHYEGEERKVKKNSNNIEYYLWERKQGKNNHYWDCRLYNLALKEILGQKLIEMYKKLPNSNKTIEPTWNNIAILLDTWNRDFIFN